MKLVPYDVTKTHCRPIRNNEAVLKEFINSGQKCVKVEGYSHKNARSFASSFWKSMRVYGIANVVIRTRGDEVFLIRTDF